MVKFFGYIVLTACSLLMGCSRELSTEQKIHQAVETQLAIYPHSTLRDLYKNFFQDRFGPGHIIADSSSADRYLRSELSSSTSFEGADYEPTGYEGRFLRVNLGVIADGRVPYEKFFDAFVRSVNGIVMPTIAEWQQEWAEIEAVILKMNIQLDNMEADRAEIKQLLDNGGYVMHHSESFNRHYSPHYRIIERTIFEQEILPLLEK
jgi:hypothetical protein